MQTHIKKWINIRIQFMSRWNKEIHKSKIFPFTERRRRNKCLPSLQRTPVHPPVYVHPWNARPSVWKFLRSDMDCTDNDSYSKKKSKLRIFRSWLDSRARYSLLEIGYPVQQLFTFLQSILHPKSTPRV